MFQTCLVEFDERLLVSSTCDNHVLSLLKQACNVQIDWTGTVSDGDSGFRLEPKKSAFSQTSKCL